MLLYVLSRVNHMRFTINHIHAHSKSKQDLHGLSTSFPTDALVGNHMSGPGTARIRHVTPVGQGAIQGRGWENPR